MLASAPPLVVPPLSCNTSMMVAEPLASGAGVKLRVPFGVIAGPAENKPGLVLPVTRKLTDWLDSFAGPARMFVAQPGRRIGPESSVTIGLGRLEELGAALEGWSWMWKDCLKKGLAPPLAVPPLSRRTMVTSAATLASAAGVKLRVPLGATAGPAENSPGLVFPVIRKIMVWLDSLAGPGLIFVAQPVRRIGPESSVAVGLG